MNGVIINGLQEKMKCPGFVRNVNLHIGMFREEPNINRVLNATNFTETQNTVGMAIWKSKDDESQKTE